VDLRTRISRVSRVMELKFGKMDYKCQEVRGSREDEKLPFVVGNSDFSGWKGFLYPERFAISLMVFSTVGVELEVEVVVVLGPCNHQSLVSLLTLRIRRDGSEEKGDLNLAKLWFPPSLDFLPSGFPSSCHHNLEEKSTIMASSWSSSWFISSLQPHPSPRTYSFSTLDSLSFDISSIPTFYNWYSSREFRPWIPFKTSIASLISFDFDFLEAF